MKKIITPTPTFMIMIMLCLTAALHTPLHAKIYDLTQKPTEMNQTWDEYKIKGNKSFSVKNNLDRKVYIRIGYKSCGFTGFILNKGQTGKVIKAPGCQPYMVSSGDTTIEQWKGYEESLGDFMWSVDNYFGHGKINYRGKWSTDHNGKKCWENDKRPLGTRCPRYSKCTAYCP